INRELNIDLVKHEDIKIINRKKSKTSFYNLFIFEDEINKWKIYVVSNKHNGEYLMPEIKQSDYFLMVNGEINEIQKTELHFSLKQLNTIQLIVQLEFSKIKSNQNLIFD
ncbi:MAG: IPExxxVDY family protein, partial [Chitinophagales bacterium]|nr:IPExxxVDY family protein [Chitinophagales bacterium]